MQTGPLTRKPKNEKSYIAYMAAKGSGCDFCAFDSSKEQVQKEYTHFWVVHNLFKYDLWDQLDVIEHLLVVPKRHVDGLAHFSDAESKEYFKIVAAYDKNGYSTYARAANNIAKSVPHQHTHLIQLGNKKKNAVVYIRKPHIAIYI